MAQGKLIASNRQAHHNYAFLEKVEAGIELRGTEIKALRTGRCSLRDGFARFDRGELFLYNVHISEYEKGNINNHEPTRPRKLLLHKSELKKFYGHLTQGGLTIIPLSFYFKRSLVKCEIVLAKSKLKQDKRRDIKKRIAQREINRELGRRR